MKIKFLMLWTAAALSVWCTGCYRVRLKLVDASVQQPSNVALYFSAENRNGEPISGIKAGQFEIYEDNKLISTFESKQTILNPKIATVRYTLLLLDMSGSVIDSGQVPLIQEAVREFLSGMRKDDPVAIYAFDGREEIVPLSKFGPAGAKNKKAPALGAFWPEDPSTNLNGAVIKAVEAIKEAEDASDVPLRFGTLIIFTDGTDRAHRATSAQARRALVRERIDSYVIGLGGEVDTKEMKRLSTTGEVKIAAEDDVVAAFREMGSKLKAEGTKYYLLSYCSPSRAGRHKITVKTAVGKDKGKLTYAFRADGFGPGCDPYTTPGFAPMEEAERQEAERQRKLNKGVKNEDGVRQAVDDELPPGASNSSNDSAPPPAPSY